MLSRCRNLVIGLVRMPMPRIERAHLRGPRTAQAMVHSHPTRCWLLVAEKRHGTRRDRAKGCWWRDVVDGFTIRESVGGDPNLTEWFCTLRVPRTRTHLPQS